MKTVLSLLSLLFLTVPASAADAPTCAPVNQVTNLLAAGAGPDGFVVADDVPVKGAPLFDREIIVIYQGKIFIWFAKGDCIVASPLYIGDAAPAAVTPQKAPVLHGGGAEIGA